MPDETDEVEEAGDLLRERAGQRRRKLWFLVEADRWLVTASLLAIVFVTLTVAGYVAPTAEGALMGTDSVDTVFQGFLTATITGVTLVLTLNQLVLSQELGSVSDQRERMEGALEFRSDTADAMGEPVSPSKPSEFLRALVRESGESAERLRSEVGEDGPLADEVGSLTEGLVEDAERVGEGLDGAQFGEFDVVSSALNFNYSRKIFAAQRVRERYAESLSEEGEEEVERLVELLKKFGLAREHFKTLYFQWSLIDLSRRILVAAVPALLVSVAMVLFFDASAYTEVLGGGGAVLAVVAAVTVASSPFVVLLAYVLRIATVTKRTLSIGPFVLREADDVAEVYTDEGSGG
jgi:hypothetical protein